MCAEQHRLEPHHRRVARGDVRDRLDPAAALDRDGGHQRVHPRPRHRVVVDVDEADPARLREPPRDRQHRFVVAALRRVELDRDDPFALAQRTREAGLTLRRGRGRGEVALGEHRRCHRGALPGDGLGDRRDLRGGGAAAAADDAGAEGAGVGCELAEVVWSRVREDDAAARAAGVADVRRRRQHGSAAGHLAECGERGRRARAAVRPKRRHL